MTAEAVIHVATVAGGADAAAFAGEGHDKARAAARAQRTAESEAEQPALEIAAELLLDIAGHGTLSGFPPDEPTLEVLRHDLVERRLLGAAPLVTAGRRGASVRTAREKSGPGLPADGSQSGLGERRATTRHRLRREGP